MPLVIAQANIRREKNSSISIITQKTKYKPRPRIGVIAFQSDCVDAGLKEKSADSPAAM